MSESNHWASSYTFCGPMLCMPLMHLLACDTCQWGHAPCSLTWRGALAEAAAAAAAAFFVPMFFMASREPVAASRTRTRMNALSPLLWPKRAAACQTESHQAGKQLVLENQCG